MKLFKSMRIIPLNLKVQIWDLLTTATHQKIALLALLSLILISYLSLETNSFIISNFCLGAFSPSYCKDMGMAENSFSDFQGPHCPLSLLHCVLARKLLASSSLEQSRAPCPCVVWSTQWMWSTQIWWVCLL